MEGFDVGFPTANRFIIGATEGELVVIGIGKDTDFFMKDVVGVKPRARQFVIAARVKFYGW